MSYVNGQIIKQLRKKANYTQKELAKQLCLSDKTISKWESGRGLPDISILPELASALHVSITELFTGEQIINKNISGNIKKTYLYVCPICGNIIYSMGEGVFSCCGIQLPKLEYENCDDEHHLRIETIENEYYVTSSHPMDKDHFISFIAYITLDSIQFIKLYPQFELQARFMRKGHGMIYMYCQRHGLFVQKCK